MTTEHMIDLSKRDEKTFQSLANTCLQLWKLVGILEKDRDELRNEVARLREKPEES